MAKQRASKAARGYGPAHQALRKTYEPIVRAGAATCWRCGKRIDAHAEWDLGHDDHDRSVYRGPEHVVCNRSTTGSARKRRDAMGVKQPEALKFFGPVF